MANVLIGIVGVVLFIGLSLAGASFFGPVVNESLTEAKSGGVVQILTTTAKAVSMRNREQETITGGSADSAVLVADYLADVPVNPVTGGAVMILNSSMGTSGGAGRMIATKLGTETAICSYIDRRGGGTGTIPTVSSMPTQSVGCAKAGATLGPMASGEIFAYVAMS